MNIMDMTLRQILHSINLVEVLGTLSFLLNLEATVRQVAVNKGYTKTVTWCDKIAGIITFIIDVFATVKTKQVTKTAPVILLCLSLTLLTGCASAGMNAMCGHIQGNQVTIPYVGGRADGDVIACHMGCFGIACPKPNYADLTAITEAYASQQNDKMSVPGPGTITYTPANKT